MSWNIKKEFNEVEIPKKIIGCQRCHALIYQDSAFYVQNGGGRDYYCGRCKPPYDVIKYNEPFHKPFNITYFKLVPSSYVEVDEAGVEIKK